MQYLTHFMDDTCVTCTNSYATIVRNKQIAKVSFFFGVMAMHFCLRHARQQTYDCFSKANRHKMRFSGLRLTFLA